MESSPQFRGHTCFTEEDFNAEYVNEAHMRAFADALNADDNAVFLEQPMSPSVGSRPSTPGLPGHRGSTRIRKVSALSDFAPVNVKVKRRKRGEREHEKRQEWLFLLVRWPLLFSIFLFIMCEFGFYVIIRQLVNAKEWLSAWRGRKGQLRKRSRAATTYQEWKDTAEVLDEYLDFNEWKRIDEDPFYDWRLVRKVKRSLRSLREKNDARGVLGVLETCIRSNFAGVESTRRVFLDWLLEFARLMAGSDCTTFYGTKDLLESYVIEQENALKYVRETPLLSNDEKRRFFKTANTNLGLTALCLSGGASFGYYHFGVVKAFLDADLLPRVVTGTSAGGLVAALACTRTDAELKNLLVPELANKISACEEPFKIWFRRFWTTGARPTKLLNYLTAPDTIIWSALLASAAVPGILNPVVLMQKLKDGQIIPWNWGSKFKDGSLRVDIPVQSLNLYFNVTHPVVSQVNPHVHLFFFAPRGSAGKPVAHMKGKGWRGNFLLSAAEQWLKLELTKNFKLIRDLELLPQLLGQDWSSVFLQRFDGTVTIWPRTRFMDWIGILSDPDPPELARMIHVGQIVTWPKLHMIENRLRLERQIYLGRQAIRKAQQTRTKESSSMPMGSLGTTADPAAQLHSVSASPVLGNNVETPLAPDTDAENAFVNGAQPFVRRGNVPHSADGTTAEGNAQSHHHLPHSSVTHRKWAAESYSQGADKPQRSGTAEQPKADSAIERSRHSGQLKPGSFLARLRAQSFPGLPSPFSSNRRDDGHLYGEETGQAHGVDTAWSSDSSSGDDLSIEEQREILHPSILQYPGGLERIDSEDQVGDVGGVNRDDDF
ncbi:hypothetical protein EW146_g4984 [Bondarzewia mesenterica]|uniref:Patatin-like phospholipase domain-containing protein n=1 Tax=Bondarzewia mesenterica TaxID=1095465 RepID=A0A4S4LYL3_9AGAM|nr:hypothetical protein EW146_g4984 [Bondarzewia mesenterica]